MNIEKLVNEVIPPSDYQHRNGFNNIPIIEKLSGDKKSELEEALIHKLLFDSEKEIDTLIIETLAYLKSHKSLPVLQDLLINSQDYTIKLIIAASIFEISGDVEMIETAAACFRELEKDKGPYFVYRVTDAFVYLTKFKDAKLNDIIEAYTHHKEYLIAYNAKLALGKAAGRN